MNIIEKEKIEIDFWKQSKSENPASFSFDNFLNKMGDCAIFYKILKKYSFIIKDSPIILELGAGQGWASCTVKKLYDKYLITSDISPYAVESLKYWEELYKVKIEESFACTSYQIPRENDSVDLIFCFAAAHHFIKHRKTLLEIQRVLKKNGKCIYMYEPSCTKFMYRLAYKRVNKKRPEVPEDVLIYKKIKSIAESMGLKATVEFYPSMDKRGPLETVYYYVLNKLPFLQKILPSTANYIFEKK